MSIDSDIRFNGQQHICSVFACSGAGQPKVAAETHWLLYPNRVNAVWSVCEDCDAESREFDKRHYRGRYRLLYLPIIQPIVGDENALAFEAFMLTVARILRCYLRPEEHDADLALLRAAQQQAYEARIEREKVAA